MIPPKVILLIPKLGTSNPHELVAVRDAVVRLLHGAGLDLHDLAKASTGASALPTPAPALGFADMVRAVRDLDDGKLTPRERAFVADMVRRGFGFRPSQRQFDWMVAIFDRLSCGRAAA